MIAAIAPPADIANHVHPAIGDVVLAITWRVMLRPATARLARVAGLKP